MDEHSLPTRLERKIIYESDYVCLYAEKVKLPGGAVIEKYHQIHYPHEAVSVVLFVAVIAVLICVFSAVSSVSGIKHTNDEDSEA